MYEESHLFNQRNIIMSPIDFFDKCRYWGTSRNPILNKLKYYAAVNCIVSLFANLFLPIYFFLTKRNKNYALVSSLQSGKKVIVSLTSFPKRIPTLHLVIECLMRQTIKPDRIVLYLTKSQVPNIDSLPSSLLGLCKRGLEIQLCSDEIRSHTKYFYAMQQFPEDIVITVDDDLFYRSDLVESLLKNHASHPNAIIANWTKEIIPGKTKYNEWPDNHIPQLPHENCSQLILGVSGVLYPPHSLDEDVFDVEKIINLSLTADDVWLTAMARKKGTPIYFTGYEYNHLPVMIRNNETLLSGNYVRNQQWIEKIAEVYPGIWD